MFGRTVAWGLDIGSATIKAAKMRKTATGVEVIDFDVVEIEYSEDESTRLARIQAALAELVRRKKFGRTPVLFSVPGNQVFFRPFNLPAVGAGKVAEIVRYEARQQVPFALEEVVWDYQAAPTGPAGEMTVSLVAIRKEIVDRLLEALQEFNMNVVGLAPSPIAALNYVHYDVGPRETSLVLDTGAKVTDFVILNGDSFWFRPLPVAGGDITRVLEQKFRIPYAEAENLKLKMGESKQADKMFQVIEPTLRSLAGEIQRTAGYYKSLSRDVRIARVFGIGHSYQLPGLADFISKNIEMGLEVLAAPQRIEVSHAVDTTWFAEEFQGMGAALGLGLQALGMARVRLSLLPEAIKKANRARVRRVFLTGVAAAVIGLVACEYFTVKNQVVGVDDLTDRMKDTIKKVASERKKVLASGHSVPARQEQLSRWANIGLEHGLYSTVMDKVLAVVEQHNDALNPASDRAAGHLYLSRLYVGWENPLVGLPESASWSDDFRQGLREFAPPSRSEVFVAARFECRGERADPAVAFEEKLHSVPGFLSPRPVVKGKAAKDKWTVGALRYEDISHLGWTSDSRDGGDKKGVVFWAVWRCAVDGDGARPGAARLATP